MRKEGDSNPRYAFDAHTLSRRASSATRAASAKSHHSFLDNIFRLCKQILFPWSVIWFLYNMFNHHLGYSLETGFFDIYCLISPFTFSIAPFSREEYGCAK